MSSQINRFNELLKLTQLYFFQEFKLSDWIVTTPEIYTYFKQERQELLTQNQILPSKIEPVSIPKEIPNVEEKSEKILVSAIKLEAMETPSPVDFGDIRKAVQERYPHLKLLDTPQKKSKKVIVLYTNDEAPLHQIFLTNLVQAMDRCLLPTSLVNASKVEASNGWESLIKNSTLKILLLQQKDLESLPHLSRYCQRTNPLQVLFLPDTSLLLREPARKRELWESLEAACSKISHD